MEKRQQNEEGSEKEQKNEEENNGMWANERTRRIKRVVVKAKEEKNKLRRESEE